VKNICLLMTLLLAFVIAGCSQAGTNSTAQTQTPAQRTTSTGPDNPEITTSVDANGTRTETRTFRNNPHISKVVVTTRNGQRTVRAYSPSGEEREVKGDENVLEATGDKVAAAAGWVADKAEDVPGEAKSGAKKVGDKTADVAGDVKDKTVSTTKKVAKETGDKTEDAADKTVSTSKKVGDKTVEGAKKVGSETKKAVKKVIP